MNKIIKGFFGSFSQYFDLPKQIYILALQRFVNSVGGFVYPFLAMFLSTRLGLDTAQIGFIMLISAVAGIPGTLISGYLVDHFNRKIILIIPSAITAIIFIICGFLGNSILIPHLIILSSFFRSFSGPASGAMTTDLTTPTNRKQSFSFLYLSMNLGLAVGFTLAGKLFENYTDWLFFGDGITTLLSLSLVLIFIKDTKPNQKEIDKINASSRTEEMEEKGHIISALIKRPFLLAFVVITTIIGFVYQQHGFIMPLHLEELFPKLGASYFGNIMTVNTLIVIFFTPILMQLTKKFKPLFNIAIASIAYIIGFGMLSFSNDIYWFVLSAFIWTTGEIIATVNTGVYISNHSPINQRGGFSSIIHLIQHIGRSMAPYIMGLYLLDHSKSQGWLLTAVIACFAFISIVLLNSYENKRKIKS